MLPDILGQFAVSGFDMRTIVFSKQTALSLETLGAQGGALREAQTLKSSSELRRLKDDLVDELHHLGWVVMRGLVGEPDLVLLGLASLVGTVGVPVPELDAGPLIMDITPEKPIDLHVEISSRSATAFDLHTDLSYVERPPDFISVLCLQPDVEGKGRTIFSDLRSCVGKLSKNTLQELLAPQFTFIVPPRCRGGTQDHLPILTQNDAGEFDIRVRFDKVLAPSESAANAIHELHKALLANRVEFLLGKNSGYIIDNRRVVHGRTHIEFRGDQHERLLKRVYGMRQLSSALHKPKRRRSRWPN
jgi:alpha-ketoglutarate-dependent taurine dioxygenase